MKTFLKIIDIIFFKVIPIFLVAVSILYFLYPKYIYSEYLRYGDWDFHFPFYIWLRGDAFYQFIIELMINNILIVISVILIGIGKGIHSTELRKRFLYFWPLYFIISIGVLSDFAGGIYNYNSLLFYVSFTVSQLMYLLFYKLFKSEKNYFTQYIKKIFRRVFEINKGIFRLLIIVFSILSVFIGFVTSAESFSGGDAVLVFGILFTVMYFFLFWISLWLIIIIVNWVMEGFKAEK